MTVTADDLARATKRLRQHPADYSAWLEVAALLGALGSIEDAEHAFATIGEGARVSGKVALAVACGRHLAELGSVHGPELVEQIVDTYATGGPHFAFEAPPAPDEPPALAEPAGDPITQARIVIEALGAWLTARQAKQATPAPLLSALSKPGARALVGVMTTRAFATGATIIEAGTPATALYWIAHGSVSVRRDGAELGELHSGAFFGEIALVGGTTRTASVVAREESWLLEIPARAVENAAGKHPKLAEVLAFHARARLLANLTRTSELFRALGDEDRELLLAKFTSELVPADTTFIHEGKTNEYLWVVVSGKCAVKSKGGIVAELGPGAAVGEISLVSGVPAVADVVAIEPAVLLRLAKQDFEATAKRHPQLLAEVEKLVVKRETANRALFQDASDLIV
ncbi:MAG: cAMP-binding protein [Myxococcales bacterium]|nr:cAMP-binding protein [Myxococcales bacterium]